MTFSFLRKLRQPIRKDGFASFPDLPKVVCDTRGAPLAAPFSGGRGATLAKRAGLTATPWFPRQRQRDRG
jgi:hypothetical protein